MDWKIVAAGLLVVLYAAAAQGAAISGTCDSASIQCNLTLKDLEVCNDSQSFENYNAYFNGEAGGWFNVIPNKFGLDAGQCAQLKVYTVANCYAEPGTYSAMLVVQGKQATYATCRLNLSQGHRVDVEISPSGQEATQCEQKDYTIRLTNKTEVENQSTERADLSVSGLPHEWYALESGQVLVKKGEPEEVKLSVKAPCGADFGNYKFTARASLPNPAFYTEAQAEYSIKQGQGVDIRLPESMAKGTAEACIETPHESQITITNTGKLEDSYEISISGAPFVKLGTTSATLLPGETETIGLKFLQASQNEGDFNATLKVKSRNYDYETRKEIIVKLRDCYGIEVEKAKGSESVCAEDPPVYSFRLHNTKTNPIEATVSISGIGAELSDSKVSLGPGQEKEITAKLDVAGLASEAKVRKEGIAVELIVDTSGSMMEKAEGETKIGAAKAEIIRLVNSINQIDLGLRVLGQGELCEDSELLVPITRLNIPKITDSVSGFRPAGKTPLAQAITAAGNDFTEGKKKVLIIVSDGKETCGGNVPNAGRILAQKGITAYAIGFDIDKEGKGQLQEVANRAKGKYFDAGSAEELSSVLKQVSQDLNITPSSPGTKTFAFKIDSADFSYEKDFTLQASDCYSAALIMPELNACGGVAKSDYFSIANLGTKDQEFEIAYSPEWVTGPAKVSVKAGETANSKFLAQPPKGAPDKFSISAKSERISLLQGKSVNYLSNASCYGVDIIMNSTELDAATCQGVKQELTLENRGAVDQQISVSADRNFVYIAENDLPVKAGERKALNYFVSPPFDLPATTFITFTATTDNGFTTQAKLRLYVRGNEESYGLGEADVRLRDLNITELKDSNYQIAIDFMVYNDSNRALKVFSAKALDFNGTVQIEKQSIAPAKSAAARLLVNLPDTNTETYTIPISFETDQGTYTRNIVFNNADLNAGTPAKAAEKASIGTGLFTLANISTLVLGVLIMVVIALIALSSYRAVKQQDSEAQPHETPEEKKPKPAKARASKKTAKKPKK